VKIKINLLKIATITYLLVVPLRGHFQLLIPGSDIIEDPTNSTTGINCMFCHPFEGEIMNMAYPAEFGVMIKGGNRVDLLQVEAAR
jgi:hypothetical protein